MPPAMQDAGTDEKGIIAWFARNNVAANLLMMFIVITGTMSVLNIKKALTPEFDINVVEITMAYPGAAPGEVEQGIILKLEEALKDIDGIKRVQSEARESLGMVSVEVLDDYDIAVVMDEIKIKVDGINEFPEEAEKPIIEKMSLYFRAMHLQIYGNIDERAGKYLAEEVKRELLADDYVSKVEIWGTRDYEITIEVSESDLRKYGLTLNRVARAVGDASLDIPGGSIRTENGDIMLRTKGQAYNQYEFEKVVLLSNADGTRLTLGDIATIRDAFVETDGFATFNGAYSVGLAISAVGNQDIIKVADRVRAYIEKKRPSLPEGVYLDEWADSTYYLNGRLMMMLKNLLLGALMVFVILSIFMDLKIAFWVMIGLPVCFLGAFALMPLQPFDVSLNLISLFGFILVLGIMVDDAIIIGESVYTATENGKHSVDTVIKGAKRVAVPATFGVLTTICAFMPTLFVDGMLHNFPAACGYVVLFCLTFSLIESKWILPAHLAHMNTGMFRWIKNDRQNRLQLKVNEKLLHFVENSYRPFVLKAIENRYTTFAVFLGALILTAGLIGGGWVRYVMQPQLPNDYVQANLTMARGTADNQTRNAINGMLAAVNKVNDDYKAKTGDEKGFIKHIFNYGSQGIIGFFMIELTKSEEREIGSGEIVKLWREEVGEIPGAKELSISDGDPLQGDDLAFVLTSKDELQLKEAANSLSHHLETYAGVYDIKNGVGEVVDEIHLKIKPSAEALGLSMADLGRQVREAFYGAQAQRIQRDNEEIKVMVRYPLADRRSEADLEKMYIRTLDGIEVPITSVAELQVLPGYAKSIRINGETAVPVSASVDKKRVEPSRVVKEVTEEYFLELKERFPDVDLKLDGSSLEDGNIEKSLFEGFIVSLFGIFALLAIPLRSYLQPIIIMSVIPFGIIGAVIGHVVMGMAISMMSIFGIIALSGVVVNDSLIMVDFVNRAVAWGKPRRQAVVDAGCQRFRAILLTSLTTFFGILPMLLETSVQALFVIPMAVSLGFGIVFATAITLVLVPCLYIMLDDFNSLFSAESESPNPSSERERKLAALETARLNLSD